MKRTCGLALFLLALPVAAQRPAPGGPKLRVLPTPFPDRGGALVIATPSPAPLATVELGGLKPDAALWAWTGGGPQGEPKAGSPRVQVAKGAKELYLLDQKSGLLASVSLSGVKNGKLDVSKAVFFAPKPGSVTVKTLSSAKKPVAGASVALVAEAGASRSQQSGVTDAKGEARFENVMPGKVTVDVTAGKVKSSVNAILLPPSPGGNVEQVVSLSGADADLAPTPAPAGGTGTAPQVIVVDSSKPEPKSDAVSGWVGLMLLGVGGFFGWRWLKNRGMTVKDALEKAGVNLPDEAGGGVNPNLRPPSPASAPLPPLPSLSDLPSAGPPSASGVPFAGSSPGAGPPLSSPTGQPKLVGLRGPVAGVLIPLVDAVTVGREEGNALALAGDSTASRKHAVILPGASGWEIADSGSANGTFVNGQRISAPTPLAHGDEIAIGTARLRYEG